MKVVYRVCYLVSCHGKLYEINGSFISQNKKRKILRWFEQTFDSVSGDDQLLHLEEFTRALHINGVSHGCRCASMHLPESMSIQHTHCTVC